MMELTYEIVHELISFDFQKGKLFWKFRDRKWFSSDGNFKSWNTRYAGKEAFTSKISQGYFCGRIFDKTYLAHRIIWFAFYGYWPEQVDHENGKRTDNSIKNMREVNDQVNRMNLSIPKHNSSGFMGVSYHEKDKVWRARAVLKGKEHYFGSSPSFEEACELWKIGTEKLGFHKNHGKKLIVV